MTSRTTILVVDDEEGVRFPICRFLQAGGYEVQEAASVAAALDVFRRAPADAALLDFSLPDGDGLARRAASRRWIPDCPCSSSPATAPSTWP